MIETGKTDYERTFQRTSTPFIFAVNVRNNYMLLTTLIDLY